MDLESPVEYRPRCWQAFASLIAGLMPVFSFVFIGVTGRLLANLPDYLGVIPFLLFEFSPIAGLILGIVALWKIRRRKELLGIYYAFGGIGLSVSWLIFFAWMITLINDAWSGHD